MAGTERFGTTENGPATEVFNSNQFNQGFAVGPKVSLNYKDDSGYGLELLYFNVLNLTASKTVGPENPANWYIMKAPGFWQTQDFPYQGMTWGSTTNLYNAEANAKSKVTKGVSLLAGFRWIQLNDSLTGSLTPADKNVPAWKPDPNSHTLPPCGDPTLDYIGTCSGASGAQVSGYPPFWNTSTTNNLFGLQAGAEGTLIELGQLSLSGTLKAGVYNNRATQSDWVSLEKNLYSSSATRNRASFVGDGSLQLKYAIFNGVTVKVGYEILWLDKVALAPGQIPQVYSGSNPSKVTASNVNAGSNILFQGGTVGMEYSF
ncbi:MAG: hypothetical protein ACKOD7_04815 [Polynucleobacter victoriensis]